MNNTKIEGKTQPATESIGSLDHEVPQEQMKAIHSALQQYFGAEDWLAERNRKFPGLFVGWHPDRHID